MVYLPQSPTPFCENIQDLRMRLCNEIKPIRLGGYYINQRMYVDLLSILVGHVNDGALPNFQDVFLNLINKEVNTNLDEARNLFKIHFSQQIVEGMDDANIDELYHKAANVIMKSFKRNLDPYLNVGEEIESVFTEFVKVYNDTKCENGRYNENLDYSESIDTSHNDQSPAKYYESGINLLNSEYDHRPIMTSESMQKSDKNSEQESEITDALKHRIEELQHELSLKEEKILEYEHQSFTSGPSSTLNSPKPETTPIEKDLKSLKQQLLSTENELSKKTALFQQEIQFYSSKSEEANKTIQSLKDNLVSQKEKFSLMLQETTQRKAQEISLINNSLEEKSERVIELERQLLALQRELDKEKEVRRSSQSEYELAIKEKN